MRGAGAFRIGRNGVAVIDVVDPGRNGVSVGRALSTSRGAAGYGNADKNRNGAPIGTERSSCRRSVISVRVINVVVVSRAGVIVLGALPAGRSRM